MSDPSLRAEIQRLEDQYAAHPGSLIFARLADLLRKEGEPERALEVLDQGLAGHPDYLSAHIVRARTLSDLGREVQAESAFRRVLELDEQNLVALRSLAGMAEGQGDREAAAGWYERLLAVDPRNEEAENALERLGGASALPASGPAPSEPASSESGGADRSEAGAAPPVEAGGLASPGPRVESEPEGGRDGEVELGGDGEPETGREAGAGVFGEDEDSEAFGESWASHDAVDLGPSDAFGIEAESAGPSGAWLDDALTGETAPDGTSEPEAPADEVPLPVSGGWPWGREEPETEPGPEPGPEPEAEPGPEPEAEPDLLDDALVPADPGWIVLPEEPAGPAAPVPPAPVPEELGPRLREAGPEPAEIGSTELDSDAERVEAPELEPEAEEPATVEPEPEEAEEGPERAGEGPLGALEAEAEGDLPTETLATLYATQGLYREAVTIYEQLVRRRPHDPALVERLRAAREELSGGEPAAEEASDVTEPAEPASPGGAGEPMWREPSAGPARAGGASREPEPAAVAHGDEAGMTGEPSIREHLQALLRGEAEPSTGERAVD